MDESRCTKSEAEIKRFTDTHRVERMESVECLCKTSVDVVSLL